MPFISAKTAQLQALQNLWDRPLVVEGGIFGILLLIIVFIFAVCLYEKKHLSIQWIHGSYPSKAHPVMSPDYKIRCGRKITCGRMVETPVGK